MRWNACRAKALDDLFNLVTTSHLGPLPFSSHAFIARCLNSTLATPTGSAFLHRRPYDASKPISVRRFQECSVQRNTSDRSNASERNVSSPRDQQAGQREQAIENSTSPEIDEAPTGARKSDHSSAGKDQPGREGKVTASLPVDKPKQKKEAWQVQKEALKEKFGDEGWKPRKRLSPDAIEGIRALNRQDPDRYTTPVLAEQFKVSPEAIRRILRSKWQPSPEEMEDRRKRWDRRGEKIWTQLAELGTRPPKKWREMGIGKAAPREPPKWKRAAYWRQQEEIRRRRESIIAMPARPARTVRLESFADRIL